MKEWRKDGRGRHEVGTGGKGEEGRNCREMTRKGGLKDTPPQMVTGVLFYVKTPTIRNLKYSRDDKA